MSRLAHLHAKLQRQGDPRAGRRKWARFRPSPQGGYGLDPAELRACLNWAGVHAFTVEAGLNPDGDCADWATNDKALLRLALAHGAFVCEQPAAGELARPRADADKSTVSGLEAMIKLGPYRPRRDGAVRRLFRGSTIFCRASARIAHCSARIGSPLETTRRYWTPAGETF
jgi:hypothetical protein